MFLGENEGHASFALSVERVERLLQTFFDGSTEEALAALEETGKKLGLCFQIVDDILNVEGDARTLGKATGSDASARKATYPALFGILQSQKQAKALTDEALDAMKDWGEDAEPLRELTRYLLARSS